MTRIDRSKEGRRVQKEEERNQWKPAWRIGVYIRLSKEDGRCLDESESVTNQREINLEFIREKFLGESYRIVGEYVDDGRTGTSEEARPEFKRLCRDIASGKVNCVVCKTLSRAFRNYADQGKFLEQFLPEHNCRFIAVGSPFVDTYKDPALLYSLEVPINGLMNDRYAARTSEDVRRTFQTKRKKGEFIGAFAPYGYSKKAGDKNALVIDPEASAVVRGIFEKFLAGESKGEIAAWLNAQGILCPTRYKQEQLRQNYQNPNVLPGSRTLWSTGTIREILKNRMYCGDMVQGRYRIKSYKVHIQERMPEREWFVVENTHEPIIDRDMFCQVQNLLERETRRPPGKTAVCLFSGLLWCGDCKHSMNRSRTKDKIYYYCGTYKKRSKRACSKHMVRHSSLEAALLQILRLFVYLGIDWEETNGKLCQSPAESTLEQCIKAAERHQIQQMERIGRYQRLAYEDWKEGRITQRDFERIKTEYDHQAAWLERESGKGEDKTSEEKEDEEECSGGWREILQKQTILKLSRDSLLELVEGIRIYEEGRICIVFRFRKLKGEG